MAPKSKASSSKSRPIGGNEPLSPYFTSKRTRKHENIQKQYTAKVASARQKMARLTSEHEKNLKAQRVGRAAAVVKLLRRKLGVEEQLMASAQRLHEQYVIVNKTLAAVLANRENQEREMENAETAA